MSRFLELAKPCFAQSNNFNQHPHVPWIGDHVEFGLIVLHVVPEPNNFDSGVHILSQAGKDHSRRCI